MRPTIEKVKKDCQFPRRCRVYSPKHLWIRDMVSHSVRSSLIRPQKRALDVQNEMGLCALPKEGNGRESKWDLKQEIDGRTDSYADMR